MSEQPGDKPSPEIIEIRFLLDCASSARNIRCSADITADRAIQELVRLGFLPPPRKTTNYTLAGPGGRTIPPRTTLGSAGIRTGDTLSVEDRQCIS